ncbi:MAG: hypothetical protein CMG75_10540 [Candidatus Marinimicrobia bacterium]|nr:hypothetical protein [Candidatus Neomarinimicrobiota bacterium]|tara:strand:+ start:7858 stop:9087 length:1230 start_codon:yes stop_codon:yes gene_type:complete
MNLLSLIARRHIASSHNLSFLSFVSYLSIAGLTIGITVLILTLGILKGFEKEVQEKIIGFDGHIRIRGFLGNPLSDYQPQLDSILASIPEVSGRLPYIHHAATVRLFGKTEAVFVEAFDPSIAENVLQTSKSLIDGNFNLIDTESKKPGIIIGKVLADKLKVKNIGQLINIMDLTSIGKPGRAPRIMQCEISGIYKTGLNEYDESIVYIDLKSAQRLFNYENLVTGEILSLKTLLDTEDVSDVLNENLNYPLMSSTWKERHSNLFEWLSLQKYPITVVFALIALVAVLNIMSSLTMIVMEKNKDIAIMRAMGFSRKNISQLFFLEGGIVGFCGVVLGALLALFLGWIQTRFNIFSIPEEVYFMSNLPIDIALSHILTVGFFGLLAAIIASLYPAWKASGIEPAKAIRYE